MSKLTPSDDMKEKVQFLVVDDDAMVRTILIEYLVSYGFTRIDEARNGREAMKLIQSQNKAYDIVISDWEMPEMDGLTFLKAIRNNPTTAMITRFIMVTSQSSQERFKISRAAKSRVDAYMVKPFRGDVLKKKIYEVMGWKVEEKSA